MSISKMIAAHPDVTEVNEPLAVAVRHAMFCAVICTSCADACTAEAMDMRQCIRTCLDCADICETTAKVAVRQTGRSILIVQAMLESCIAACDVCAAECERHDHPHCWRCAEMCRECADDCRRALPTVH
ncbi:MULTISPECIES: four-helix bundle copper-binding protein [Sphingomonadales]|uniref:Four-helix bundle copper-binding protein n=3 Tax=Edaphosphingomonas TaxID=3423724 RepID=A0A2T4I6I4_9SPHN|nr:MULTISPECIES: four-helix bundle copper-binding protein [Sphingomonas]AGH48323.1 hypothetical protein G432_02980 [Sphingomonas sp. MM-1]MDX3883508.1 four-helix bundle copper-binding protein [Sphingomonas sp.]OHT20795.1 hypothetical protein BHE75_02797 [Sphingomonas haloaromaticamans]PTD26175.1 four-helix bundle copper-binding protein [Sphingomonas fennica]